MKSMFLGTLGMAVLLGSAPQAGAAAERLFISEFVVTPTAGEMVEIHNPGNYTVDLTDVYLTDATFAGGSTYYYQVVQGGGGGGGFGDFHARFPSGASIGPGEYQTVSCAGSDDFMTTYGVLPTYELYEDGAGADAVPDMLEVFAGSINGQGGLTNSGEVVILYYWDGASDLVTDLDYVVYGDKVEAVDKTGVLIDGPDGDVIDSAYAADTSIAAQDVSSTGQPHASGESAQRLRLSEGRETRAGGNGITDGTGYTGNDETSENTSQTFVSAAYTPNAAAVGSIELNVSPGTPGANTVTLTGATPTDVVFFLASFGEGFIPAEGKCPGSGEAIGVDFAGISIFAVGTDGSGNISAPSTLPTLGMTVHLQVIDLNACMVSNLSRISL